MSQENFEFAKQGIAAIQEAYVLTLSDGKILRWQIFLTREAALEAAGLKE